MVEPHLLLAVRFLPTREGCCTKSSGHRPENRATLQVSFVSIWYAAGYCRIYWDVRGLRAPPAVTSAIEVLIQTFVSRFYGRVQNRTAVQNVDVVFER